MDIDHALYPLAGGPTGSLPLYFSNGHAIMKYSKNQKLAKDLLRWLHKTENYEKWFQVCEGYSVGRHQEVGEARDVGPGRQAAADVPHRGARHPHLRLRGPVHGKATEAFTKYIIVDMYAKAVQGMKAEDAVKWAEGELKKIYEADRRGRPRAQEGSMTTPRARIGSTSQRRTSWPEPAPASPRRPASRHPGRRRAPAFAQGTQAPHRPLGGLHPRLRRRAEAPGRRGQQGARRRGRSSSSSTPTTCSRASPRPSSRGSGPDIIQMLHNWPHLYAERPRRRHRPRRVAGQGAGRLLRAVRGRTPRSAASAWPCPTASCPASSPTGSRGSTRSAPPRSPRPTRSCARSAMKLKKKGKPVRPDARPHLRRRARPGPTRCCGTSAGRRPTRAARRRIDSKGAVEAVKFMHGVLEGRLRRGRAGLGRHQQQPRLPRRRDLRHAQRRLDLHRGQARPGEDQGRQGRADGARHPARARCPPGPAGSCELPHRLRARRS